MRTFTLSQDNQKDNWKLVNDQTGRTVQRWETKAEATAGGVLEAAVGSEGGSVRIQLENGRYQEERTYPGTADPRKSRG